MEKNEIVQKREWMRSGFPFSLDEEFAMSEEACETEDSIQCKMENQRED